MLFKMVQSNQPYFQGHQDEQLYFRSIILIEKVITRQYLKLLAIKRTLYIRIGDFLHNKCIKRRYVLII